MWPKNGPITVLKQTSVLLSICDSSPKYKLFHYLELWFSESIFPIYTNWETIMKIKILEKEADDWFLFCSDHSGMRVAQTCPANISPYHFWSIADRYPDLVSRLHVQIRLMGNFGLNGDVPWLINTDGKFCFFAKIVLRMSAIFLWIVPVLKIILNLLGQT